MMQKTFDYHDALKALAHPARLEFLAWLKGIPPPKAVCPDLLIGFKCMPYVMRYDHFPH